jgi:hypothetical protein
MIASLTWTNVARSAPLQRDLSDADRYARLEYGGPDATWLLPARQPSVLPDSNGTSPTGERLLRRITQAIASFLF